MVIFDSVLAILALVVFMSAALGCAAVNYGVPACKRGWASMERRAQEKRATDQRRWQLLKPLFVSGAITELTLEGGAFFARESITLQGPYFKGGCKVHEGTFVKRDDQGILGQVGEALSTPGTRPKDMRRVAHLLVRAIRLDQDVPVILDYVEKKEIHLKTLPSIAVTQFRKLA